MGFYGNITNTSRTQFQFDRVYSSRYQMDLACGSDGVYAGRYVLVEYGSSERDYKRGIAYNGAFREFYMYDGEVYAGLNIRTIADNQKVFITPTEDLKVKIIQKDDSGKNVNPGGLFLYPEDVVFIPKGHKVYDINKTIDYFKVSSAENGDYTNGYTTSEYEGSLGKIYDYTLAKWVNKGGTPETFDELWNSSLKDQFYIYLVDGKIIFGVSEIELPNGETLDYTNLQDYYPDSISNASTHNQIVWKLDIGNKYSTNQLNLYVQPLVLPENFLYIEGYYGQVEWSSISGEFSSYDSNYILDKEYYKTNRGYDSTVWQKTFVNGIEKYVMIAELNTVVPTFSVVNDAPSLLPLTPHFDSTSTNVYYRLHWQPSWAIRPKAASPLLMGQKINQNGIFQQSGDVPLSSDTVYYPSDQDVVWKGTFYNNIENNTYDMYYNPNINKWESVDTSTPNESRFKLPAAIYYNKDGFNSEYTAVSEDLVNLETGKFRYNAKIAESNWDASEDKVGFFPTGYSGHMYNAHDNTLEGKVAPDTQEFVMMLPSLGNAMSSIWDIIYGGRNTNPVINATLRRNRDIYWEDGSIVPNRSGLRLRGASNGYNTAEVNTIAGCINSVHDLMGMIISKEDTLQSTLDKIDSLSMNRIYYIPTESEYYRKQNQYTYTELEDASYEYVEVEFKEEKFGEYYIFRSGEYVPLTDMNDVLPNETFYKRQLKDVIEYTQLGDDELKDFNTILENNNNLVYFKDSNYKSASDAMNRATYVAERHERDEDKIFYTIDLSEEDKVSVDMEYEPNRYYYLSGSDDFYPNALLLDTESKVNTENGEYRSKEYYKLKEGRGFEEFPIIPSAYTSGTESGGIDVHAVYRPNTYYYQNKTTGDFILETSHILVNDHLPYYTFQALPKEDENGQSGNEPLYEMKISFEVPENLYDASGIPQSKSFTPGIYYYLDSDTYRDEKTGQDVPITWDLIANGKVPENKFKIASSTLDNYYENGAWKDNVKTFTTPFALNPIGFFKKNLRYELNSTVLYTLRREAIVVKPYRGGSVFVKIEDKERKISGIRFLQQSEIPITTWVPDEENGGFKLVLLNPANNLPYPDKVYYLGLNPSEQNYNKLLGIADIDAGADPNNYLQKLSGEFYEPNKYHYIRQTEDNRQGSLVLDNSISPQRDASGEIIQYYELNCEKITPIEGTYKEKGSFTYHSKDNIDRAKLNNSYYKDENENYHPFSEKAVSAFNTIVHDGDTLYELVPETSFYKPFKFYKKISNSGAYALVKDGTRPANTPLYKKNSFYVIKDDTGILGKGAEWNSDAKYVLPWITLARREDSYGLKIIDSLAREDNTIHGLILRINKILEANNEETRDLRTVQGSINALNDIIAKFDIMKSGELLMVDEYGRAHGAIWDTAQPIEFTNGGTDVVIERDVDKAHRWIKVESNPDYDQPVIQVKHTFNEKKGINFDSNKNDSNDDTLKLYTPVVDDMGHVVGKNIETTILPYGFKQIDLAQSTDTGELDTIPDIVSVVANNTKDVVTLAAANKWIRTAKGKNDTKKIEVAHALTGISGSSGTDYGLTEDLTVSATNNTFSVPVFQFDEAGHITNADTHTIKLPNNFKTVVVNNNGSESADFSSASGELEPDNLEDTLTMSAGNKWIGLKVDTDEDTVSFAHALTTATVNKNQLYGENSSDKTLKYDGASSFKTLNVKIDEAGHITSLSENTITLPEISLTSSTSSVENGVITGLGLNIDTDSNNEEKFTYTKSNLASVAIGAELSALFGPDSIAATATLKSVLETLIGKINDLKTTLNDLESTLNTQANTIAEQGNAITALQERINDLEGNTP